MALGSAVAESVYAYLAFWGFSALLVAIPWVSRAAAASRRWSLTALGLRFALTRSKPDAEVVPLPQNVGNKRSFLLGITITALNPTLMVTWGMAVTTLHSFDFVVVRCQRAVAVFARRLGGHLGLVHACSWRCSRASRAGFIPPTLDRVVRVMGVALTAARLGFAVRFVMYFHTGH